MEIKMDLEVVSELMLEQLADIAKLHAQKFFKDPVDACGNLAITIILLYNICNQMHLWDQMPAEARKRLAELFGEYGLVA
jgi:hypothetical protein